MGKLKTLLGYSNNNHNQIPQNYKINDGSYLGGGYIHEGNQTLTLDPNWATQMELARLKEELSNAQERIHELEEQLKEEQERMIEI